MVGDAAEAYYSLPAITTTPANCPYTMKFNAKETRGGFA